MRSVEGGLDDFRGASSTSCEDSITLYLLSRSLFSMVSVFSDNDNGDNSYYISFRGLFVSMRFKTTSVKAVTLDDL